MKSTVSIYFEEMYDKESEAIYNLLSDEQREMFFISWKKEIEQVIHNEFAKDVQNLKIEFKVVE